jgi:DNA-binding MarR family transcriptional regulator
LIHPRQNLIFLTNRVGRQLARVMLEYMEFEGFLPLGTHMGLLSDIVLADGQRQQDLAISTIKDKGTVARSLKQLETAGIINRTVDAEDRRQKRIHITAKGLRLWEYARSHAGHAMDCAQKGIPDEDLTLCTTVLEKIYDNLHQQLSSPQSITNESAA